MKNNNNKSNKQASKKQNKNKTQRKPNNAISLVPSGQR